jgi:hypothetical protein
VSLDIFDSVLRLEHDHTRLEVFLEDLVEIARQGFEATDEQLLEDARATWALLQGEITRHFVLEEGRFFEQFAGRFPELRPRLQRFREQHEQLRGLMVGLGAMLQGSTRDVLTRRADFQPLWETLWRMWRAHSREEWEMLHELSQRGTHAASLELPG